MKKTIMFLAAIAALYSGNGSAADFGTSSDYIANMGVVQANMSGNIESSGDGYLFDYAKGSLTSNTQIEFSYSINPSWVGGQDPYQFTVIPPADAANGSYKVSKWTVLDQNGIDTFKIVIANFAAAPLKFWSGMYLPNYTGEVATSYFTTHVPLPAALPLFGLGLVGLAGYKRMKKKAA